MPIPLPAVFSPENLAKASQGVELSRPADPPSQSISPIYKWLGPIGQGADLASSLVAEHRGFHEANPILGNPLALIGSKVGAGIGSYLLTKALAKNHPGAAKAVGIGLGAGGLVPAGINVAQMMRD